jgi:3-oxoacyl-[acyl-carrier protein] reductase
MSDLLLDLGQNKNARKLLQGLGLPIPLPEKLRRARGPYEERPLDGRRVAVALGRGAELGGAIAEVLSRAGAEAMVVGGDLAPFRDAGEAFGHPARALANGQREALERVDAVVLDASGVASAADLGELHDTFHLFAAKIARSGRAVVLGRPPTEASTLGRAAAQRALDGFVKSLAKEVGRKGATANLVMVAAGAEARLAPVLRFLLSPRAAFVSGQPLTVTAAATSAPGSFTRPLEGKVALVTGAARGIGEATARRLAEEGAHVVCLDRPADDGPLSRVARAVKGRVLLCDVSEPGAPAAIVAALGARGVDIVVHNAGVTRDKTIARMPRALWDQALDINLGSVIAITEALLEGSLRDHGRIVCLSSVAGIAGNMGQTNYAASKAGVIGFVEHLAPRLAARGITVNAIAPGFIETRLTAAIPAVIREVGRRLSALGQGGLPEDVAEAITFLSTPGAAGIDGAILRVCGGAFIGA